MYTQNWPSACVDPHVNGATAKMFVVCVGKLNLETTSCLCVNRLQFVFLLQTMVRGCSGLLLTLLALSDHGCLGQVDQGAAQHDDMILVSYV